MIKIRSIIKLISVSDRMIQWSPDIPTHHGLFSCVENAISSHHEDEGWPGNTDDVNICNLSLAKYIGHSSSVVQTCAINYCYLLIKSDQLAEITRTPRLEQLPSL